jgi:hypothetical protein
MSGNDFDGKEVGKSGNRESTNGHRPSQGRSRVFVPGVKSVLVSVDSLDHLTDMQLRVTPRMDYRFLVEGLIELVVRKPELLDQVAVHSRDRLVKNAMSLNQSSNSLE